MEILIPGKTILLYLKSVISVELNTSHFLCTPNRIGQAE